MTIVYDVSASEWWGLVGGGISVLSLWTTCTEAKNVCLFFWSLELETFPVEFKTNFALFAALVSSSWYDY